MASTSHMIRLSFNAAQSLSKQKSKSKARSKSSSTSATPPYQRKTLSLPEDWTVKDLKEEALRLFHSGTKTSKKKISVNLLLGYPPAPLSDVKNDCIARTCIPANESLIVNFVDSASDTEKVSPSSGGNSKIPENIKSDHASTAQDSNTRQNTRKRRAAAITASSNFSEVIKAQDKLLKSEKSTSKTTRKEPSKNNARAKRNTNKNQLSSSNPHASRKMAQMTGHKLSDGSVIPGTQKAQNNRSSSSKFALKDETDVATRLLSSLESGSAGGGKIGSFLRGAMRSAVSKSYESSRAFIRVSAVQSREFQMIPNEDIHILGSDNDNNDETRTQLGLYTVQYLKGKVSNQRGTFSEDFQLISLPTLVNVIRAVYTDPDPEGGGKEMLRGRNMAQLSPRVFWSIVYHTMPVNILNKSNVDDNGASDVVLSTTVDSKSQHEHDAKDIEEGLQILLPDLDWKYLRGRTQILSEKAKENLRQKQELEKGDKEDAIELNKGIEAVDAVEEAMMQVLKEDGSLARERTARAALRRLGNEQTGVEEVSEDNTDDWVLQTPTEADLDEMKECLSEGNMKDDDILIVAKSLEKECGIRNWRQLANGDKTDILQHLITVEKHIELTEDEIDTWIDAAQNRSVDEIMMEICEFNENAVIALREGARAGTPKDLALWETIPGMLLDEMKSGLSHVNDVETLLATVNERKILLWCMRAKSTLEKHDWLNWYATPIA